MRNHYCYDYYFDLPKVRVGRAKTTEIKLSLPNATFSFFSNFPQSFNLTEIYFYPNHIDQQKVLNY